MILLVTAHLSAAAIALAVVLLGARGSGPNIRMALVIGFLGLLAVSYAGLGAVIGRAKPHNYVVRCIPDREITVLSYVLDEPVAIYVLIDDDGLRLCALPWNLEGARQLKEAEGAAGEGGGIMYGVPDDSTDGLDTREPVFHARPIPEYPPKIPPADQGVWP